MPAMTPMDDCIETDRLGTELLSHPLLNKGTAFTEDERDAFEQIGRASCRERVSSPV